MILGDTAFEPDETVAVELRAVVPDEQDMCGKGIARFLDDRRPARHRNSADGLRTDGGNDAGERVTDGRNPGASWVFPATQQGGGPHGGAGI